MTPTPTRPEPTTRCQYCWAVLGGVIGGLIGTPIGMLLGHMLFLLF